MSMRTTLTIDDDVAERLKKLVHRRRISFKEAVNSALRRGLSAPQPSRKSAKGFKVNTFRSGFKAGIDPVRLNQLVDELEVQRAVEPRS